MSQEEQAKKTRQVISDAAVNEVIPAKRISPTALSDEDLDKVAGGTLVQALLQGGVASRVIILPNIPDAEPTRK